MVARNANDDGRHGGEFRRGTAGTRRARNGWTAWRTAGLGCLIGASLMTGFAGPAGASEIVYTCGYNLCAVNPDGTGATQLTSDGSGQAGYSSPSLSRDGSKLAFAYGGKAFIGSPAAPTHATGGFSNYVQGVWLRPDGGQVLTYELLPPFINHFCLYSTVGVGESCPWSAEGLPNWGADDSHIVFPRRPGVAPNNMQIYSCPSVGTCTIAASNPNHDLYYPAVSPDGSTVAVTVEAGPLGGKQYKGSIAIYTLAVGSLLRYLTAETDTEDALPAWSPDGNQIAFVRGSAIYVAAAAGTPGSERLLVANGSDPTWGGGPGDTIAVSSSSTSTPSESTGTGTGGTTVSRSQIATLMAQEIIPSGHNAKIAQLLKRAYSLAFQALEPGTAIVDWYYRPRSTRHTKRKSKPKLVLIATGRHNFPAAGTATLKINLTPAGRRLLKHAHRLQLTAEGAFTPAGAAPVKASRAFVLAK